MVPGKPHLLLKLELQSNKSGATMTQARHCLKSYLVQGTRKQLDFVDGVFFDVKVSDDEKDAMVSHAARQSARLRKASSDSCAFRRGCTLPSWRPCSGSASP